MPWSEWDYYYVFIRVLWEVPQVLLISPPYDTSNPNCRSYNMHKWTRNVCVFRPYYTTISSMKDLIWLLYLAAFCNEHVLVCRMLIHLSVYLRLDHVLWLSYLDTSMWFLAIWKLGHYDLCRSAEYVCPLTWVCFKTKSQNNFKFGT